MGVRWGGVVWVVGGGGEEQANGEDRKREASRDVFLVAFKERRRGKSPLKSKQHADIPTKRRRYKAHTNKKHTQILTHTGGQWAISLIECAAVWGTMGGGWWEEVGGAGGSGSGDYGDGIRTHTIPQNGRTHGRRARRTLSKKFKKLKSEIYGDADRGRGPRNARRESSRLRAFSGHTP